MSFTGLRRILNTKDGFTQYFRFEHSGIYIFYVLGFWTVHNIPLSKFEEWSYAFQSIFIESKIYYKKEPLKFSPLQMTLEFKQDMLEIGLQHIPEGSKELKEFKIMLEETNKQIEDITGNKIIK
ncbi:unnamed protein product [Blepharisma stoltei]|uniref:Uncharacterized protein n=1 Tax=Blepharisma stoltei TaxID=1481888 RepID=A0AAU9JUA3_9CILI|nr:unnamed protein product [Blepharisma stoltei]